MDAGWPAVERGEIAGWRLRFSGGVTQRANSVLPLQAPADVHAAITEVEERHSARWIRPAFQLNEAAQPSDLDHILAERGYGVGSPTLVQILHGSDVPAAPTATVPDVVVAAAPDEEWLDLFWAQEGPPASEDQRVSRLILTGVPALYFSLRVAGRTESIARLALVDTDDDGESATFGGIYCVLTRPEARRRGYSRRIMTAVLAEAAHRRLAGLWLQVRESNVGAIQLYHELGFTTASSYYYRSLAVEA
ncbi:GNAT family N-acetyltransferase [Zhihengliuella flava]|uniref:Ribosomal protein S18 acetylase RimI-like enzyme n=1 Tax=Zhihengliuella flava TaxID=1285193 RepID=A0A931GGF2_9MICC|nr:GNAT family N-acetyltransferase [Zhihengliuella flava]MBG6085727.1 ribosomal protein S18 acetylase RimI-like enzyme [Zhihengliuella flava]